MELIPVLGTQPAGYVSHKPGGSLPLLSARPAVTPATLKRGCYQFCCLVNRGTVGVNSLPKTVTRHCRDCDLSPGPSAPESSTLTTRLPSHPFGSLVLKISWYCLRVFYRPLRCLGHVVCYCMPVFASVCFISVVILYNFVTFIKKIVRSRR